MEVISFSKKIKEELLHQEIDSQFERDKVHLIAAIETLATLNYKDDQLFLELKSTNIIIIRNLIKKLKSHFSYIDLQIVIREIKRFNRKNKTYILRFNRGTERLLFELELAPKNKITIFTKYQIPRYITRVDQTFKEYLKYLFICAGSINDPKIQKQYHLEIINDKQDVLEFVAEETKKFDINFKITNRKNSSALYLNKGEEIADFLKLIGATKGMFEFEDYRLFRDIRATENRLINAEIANEVKKNINAQKQIDAIYKLINNEAWNSLKEKTQIIAKVRIDNPEASLAEMEGLLGNQISKSNIRHHLNLIINKSETMVKENR